MEYRPHLHSQTWHFHRSQWPRNFNIILAETRRPDSEVCSECMALHQQKELKKEAQDS